jgi:lipopolysaccharide/colanic/teichoic acid biosynthesis glycosyltransferase
MDTHYLRNWSVWLDFVILARTIKNMVLGKGLSESRIGCIFRVVDYCCH